MTQGVGLIIAAALTASAVSAGPGEPDVPSGKDPGGVAVAHIDTGVNYTLPSIAARLARDGNGRILGYDFADDDHKPYDKRPSVRGQDDVRHGTSVATVLLREAPEARLIPLRYRAADPQTFARIVEAIAKGPARIVAMPLGGYKKEDWTAFRDAAAQHPELLFIISAGNDGRNLDEKPVYPAAFKLENAIVVTSTDPFARLPLDSNWGPATVDVSTPAEKLKSINHEGIPATVSGSSYAVPRVTALAARLRAKHPDWTAAELKQAILAAAVPSPADRTPVTRHGWLADPSRVE